MRLSSAAKLMCVPMFGAMLTGCGPSVPSEFIGKWSCPGFTYDISSRGISRTGAGGDSGTVRQVNQSGGETIVALDGTKMMGTVTLKREGGRLIIGGDLCNPA